MVFTKQLLLLLLSVILVIAGDANSNNNENVIPAVIHYLRKHNPHYYYTSGNIVQSSIKDNKLHVQSDIEAVCTFPCTGGTLSCNSVFEKPEDDENWKVTSTICAPKEPHFEGIKEYSPESEKPLVQESKKIANKEPTIISRRTDHCVGCPIDIDTNAEAVNKLVSAALKHVESEREAKHVLVKVLRVQQQVVAGIKYTLLIEIAPTICAKNVGAIECPIDSEKEKFVCEVQYWEKPWLHSSLIVKNNCTTSQNYQVEEPINTTKKPQIEPDFLSELEAQIIPESELRQHKNPVYQSYHEPNVNYYDLDFEPIPEVVVNRRQIRDIRSDDQKNDIRKDYVSSSSSSSEENERNRIIKKGHEDNSSSSESSSSSSSSSEENIRINRENKKEDVEGLLPVIKKYLNSKNIDIVKYSKVDLDETHFKLEILVEKEGDYDECSLHVIKKGDASNSIVNKECGKDRFKRDAHLLGGIKDTDLNDPALKSFLNDGLKHLDAQSTHSNRYKIKEVLTATKQVVSGVLWRVKVKIVLSNCEKGKTEDIETCGENSEPHEQICDILIHDAPWIKNGRQTNITCETDAYSFRTKRDTNFIEDSSIELRFVQFISQFKKDYGNKLEYLLRLRIFRDNLYRIYLLNKYEKGTAHYDITKFADLTANEFSHLHGLRPDLRSENDVPLQEAAIPDIELPTAFDWRDKNAVTEVKDQGMCGSCWAFSTTGNVEGQYAIKYNKLKEFSEQELVDCDKLDEGCNGGLMDNAYRTIERLGGLELESEYPYEGEDEKCHFNKSKAIVQLKGAVNISHDETDMAKWLTQNGPISIAINANAMQFYAGGVSHPWKTLCNPNELDHGVLIVGYGVHTYPLFNKTLPYWIVKNSWGKTWGEQGYYRVYRGDGTCGLNETPSSAIVA